MKTSGLTHIAQFVELCAQSGLKNVVLSPGSRNAPLTIAFEAHTSIKTYLIHDERSAAFFAMGLSESLNEPVGICCTSGSAALNYAPAVAEAYYRRIPLFIMTADRPPELIDQGDGQTIRQKEVFKNYIKSEFELPAISSGEASKESEQIASDCLNELNTGVLGPVHLNIPLYEPLYLLSDSVPSTSFVKTEVAAKELSDEQKEQIKTDWNRNEKRMILIGQQASLEAIPDSLRNLMADPSVAVLVENTSNVQDFVHICHCIDRELAGISEEELKEFQPDILITIGGAIISKRIKSFLRKHPPTVHWRVGEYLFEEDCFQALTASFSLKLHAFFDHLMSINDAALSTFGNRWKQRDFETQEKHFRYLEQTPFSDLKAFEIILSSIPENSRILMGNSSTVRYCQLFDPVRSLSYFSNRGVSGIDGCTSTAVGMTNGSDDLHTLISGDISFFYDSNALWNAYLNDRLRIIVINNGGGGIFEYIPGPSSSGQLDSFVAPHGGDVKKLCEAFDLDFKSVSDTANLEEVFHSFYTESTNGKPKVLEVNTTNCDNAGILQSYFKSLL